MKKILSVLQKDVDQFCVNLIEGLSENRGKTTIWPHCSKEQAEKPKKQKHLKRKLFHCKIIICETQAIDSRKREKFKQ